MPSIHVRHLSKKYQIYRNRADKLREVLKLSRRPLHEEFWALEDVSFDVDAGQTIGIIGQNGSGKSTLLQILAGIMRQTRGECLVSGKVSALLELGSGFNPEFTGRENVFMNGAILGLDTRQMQDRIQAITDFAEIGAFMDQPVKTYSSGMFMRLAFAVAVNVDPDILIVDEALSVGDLVFQHRCMHRMNKLRAEGKTIVLVTHDLGAVTKFCDRGILLDRGHLLEDGSPDSVVQKYRALSFERERRYGGFEDDPDAAGDNGATTRDEIPVAAGIPNVDHRFGNGDASLTGVDLLDEKSEPTREVFGGQKVTIRVTVRFNRDVAQPILGYTMRDRLGVEISACNTSYAGKVLPAGHAGQMFTADFQITLPHLAAGSYSVSPAIARGNVLKHDMCDWIDNALVFNLQTADLVYGMVKMDVDVVNYVGPVW
jgi:ABC-type polysaccharide/polyol phosphate transport system ATPase subunit